MLAQNKGIPSGTFKKLTTGRRQEAIYKLALKGAGFRSLILEQQFSVVELLLQVVAEVREVEPHEAACAFANDAGVDKLLQYCATTEEERPSRSTTAMRLSFIFQHGCGETKVAGESSARWRQNTVGHFLLCDGDTAREVGRIECASPGISSRA